MMSFDGWDARYCGDAMALPGDVLAHWRTKGSKNGVRRYQQTDGTWTPLGLRMRKQREGWGDGEGESKAERKVQKAQDRANKMANRYAKAQKKVDRANARDQARRDRMDRVKKRFEQRSLKNVSDEELQKMISRVKMEREYKELTRSPVLVAGEKMINSYFQNKKEKLDRAERKAKMEKEMTDAKARLVTAQADKAYASNRGNVAARKISAKAEFKKAKNEERKHTVRGAISQVAHNIVEKRGNNYVKKLDKTYGELIKNGAKHVGNAIGKGASKVGSGVKKGASKVGSAADKLRNKTVGDMAKRMKRARAGGRASAGLFG